MLCLANSLHGYRLLAFDGEIGKVKDFYFDDSLWTIYYLLADLSRWPANLKVIITPHALVSINKTNRNISINLTKKDIKESPTPDTHTDDHQALPIYIDVPNIWSFRFDNKYGSKFYKNKKTHTISSIYHFKIYAVDGEVGQVIDFILDDSNWNITSILATTKRFFSSRDIIIKTSWIKQINFKNSTIYVNETRHDIMEINGHDRDSRMISNNKNIYS